MGSAVIPWTTGRGADRLPVVRLGPPGGDFNEFRNVLVKRIIEVCCYVHSAEMNGAQGGTFIPLKKAEAKIIHATMAEATHSGGGPWAV